MTAPGVNVHVTTDVGYCPFCQRSRNLRREERHLGGLVRVSVECESCHRTLSSTLGPPPPVVEEVPKPAPEPEVAPTPAPAAAKKQPAAAKKPAAPRKAAATAAKKPAAAKKAAAPTVRKPAARPKSAAKKK